MKLISISESIKLRIASYSTKASETFTKLSSAEEKGKSETKIMKLQKVTRL